VLQPLDGELAGLVANVDAGFLPEAAFIDDAELYGFYAVVLLDRCGSNHLCTRS
jgi:hypothetical protein